VKETMPDQYDVVICGAGLAGLTLARQLKLTMNDISVLLLDRQTRPLPAGAFKVGESTNEVAAYYFSEVLHLSEYLEDNHLRKLGLRYFFGGGRRPFEHRPEFGLSQFPPVYTYQLDRGILENDLRMFNLDAGIEMIEDCFVEDIVLSQNHEPHNVRFCRNDRAMARSVKGRWVIDAMGRRCFLQRKLGLTRKTSEKFSAAWFRIQGRIDVDDFVQPAETWWHDRVPAKNRYYSTVHLMGDGYWVWLIPLSSGCTSIGIVTDERIHCFSKYNTIERAYSWLEEHEPAVFHEIEAQRPVDFLLMRNYSYASHKVLSEQRWACVGEAGVFSDPFYSPGSDQIGFANSLTTEAIRLDMSGKLGAELIDHADWFCLSYNEFVTEIIHAGYPFFGNALVMGMKLIWDFTAGWAFSGPLIFNSILLNLDTAEEIRKTTGKFVSLSSRIQGLFVDWANKTLNSASFGFIDYLTISFLRDLRLRNLKANKTQDELIEDHLASINIMEELAQVVFLLALEDTMPDVLTSIRQREWLNAWGISLDPGRWESDRLFHPRSAPRDLTTIDEQIRRLIRFKQ
jgi:flavin-dependent dehydrogenase